MHNNSHAGPFLKWAGGKSQLLKQYEPFFPQRPARTYHEPFLGSGAIFFHLRTQKLFERFTLADYNPELVNCYRVVRDQLEDLLTRLEEHRAAHSEDHYYAVRDQDRRPDWSNTPAVERAARMIYLNRTCYNGLWRVNSQGYFNVPMGRYKNPDIANRQRLEAASRALKGVEIETRDFEMVIKFAKPDDFVYFDPPYVPLSATANFTSYSVDNFGDSFGEYEQRKLALVFAELDRRGCQLMLSNSDTPLVRDLYEGFRIEPIRARRAISSKGLERGPVGEVLVLNY
jgi:DNA adenine methylase